MKEVNPLKKKPNRLMLHQHDIKCFIDDRDRFYKRFFTTYKEPDHEYYQVGRAVDYAIKEHYMNGDETLYTNNRDFNVLSDTNQAIVLAMVGGYIEKYKNEYFHNFQVANYKIPFRNFLIYLSPDWTALDFDNDFWILELKTGLMDQIALNFQTMMYAWAKYRWDFKPPKGVIKRILRKPTIKQTKKETEAEFHKRLTMDYVDRPDFYFITKYELTSKDLIKNFEKYLTEVCKEIEEGMKSNNRHKFYMQTDESWA